MAIFDTRREKCLQQLKAQLEGITVALGFDITIATVRREFLNIDDRTISSLFPAICFAPTSTVWDHTAGNLSAGTMEILLYFYTTRSNAVGNGSAGGDADNHGIEGLHVGIDNIIRAIHTNPLLNDGSSDLAVSCTVRGDRTNEGQYFDREPWIRIAEIDIALEWERCMTVQST